MKLMSLYIYLYDTRQSTIMRCQSNISLTILICTWDLNDFFSIKQIYSNIYHNFIILIQLKYLQITHLSKTKQDFKVYDATTSISESFEKCQQSEQRVHAPYQRTYFQ